MLKAEKNFFWNEFKCRCGVDVPSELTENMMRVIHCMQVIRDYIGEPIYVTSGYRSDLYNKAVGGVSNSYHTKGMACDFVVRGLSPILVAEKVNELMELGVIDLGGIGVYDGFVHYDIRGKKTTWDNRKTKIIN